MARPYLAIQTAATTLVLSSPDTEGSYAVKDIAFPAPSKRQAAELAMSFGARVPGNSDDLARRTLTVDCLGATQDAAEDALIALQQAIDSHRARLVWRASAASPTIWTTIRSARVDEGSLDALRRGQGKLRVTLTLTTDSEWSGDPVAFTGTDVPVAHGDRPARFRMKVTSTSANPLIGLGVKNAPSAAYDPIDTVGSPAAVNLTTTPADLHTAEAKDTNAMRGSHVVIADVATNAATAANTRYRAKATTTGSGVSSTATAIHDSTAAITTATRLTALPGTVDIPAGGVPGIEVRAGAVVGDQTQNTQNTTTAGSGTAAQSFVPAIDGTFAGVDVWVATLGQDPGVILNVYKGATATSGNLLWSSGGYNGLTLVEGENNLRVDGPILTVGLTYCFRLDFSSSTTIQAATGNPYAAGEGDWYQAPANVDLRFKTYIREPLDFASTVTIQGKCSESSKTATLASVTLLPADDFAIVAEHAFGANEGMLIEATDPIASASVYLTTSTEGTAGNAIAPLAWHGAPRLPLGENTLVIAAKGTVSVSGVYIPCYSNAAAGRL